MQPVAGRPHRRRVSVLLCRRQPAGRHLRPRTGHCRSTPALRPVAIGLVTQAAAIGQLVGPPLLAAMVKAGGSWSHARLYTVAAAALCMVAAWRATTDRDGRGAMTASNKDRAHFLLLNVGHFLDHLFTLIFATVAALALSREWGLGYSQLLAYATPGFFAFGLFSLPAGWLADKWSREGMMAVFFVGIGLASLATSLAQTPLQLGTGLFAIGVFAAIYHPVGLAIVTERWRNTGMRLAVNGVWGNLGVGSAALITGFCIDNGGWRSAFVAPALVSIAAGIVYALVFWPEISGARAFGAGQGRRPAASR